MRSRRAVAAEVSSALAALCDPRWPSLGGTLHACMHALLCPSKLRVNNAFSCAPVTYIGAYTSGVYGGCPRCGHRARGDRRENVWTAPAGGRPRRGASRDTVEAGGVRRAAPARRPADGHLRPGRLPGGAASGTAEQRPASAARPEAPCGHPGALRPPGRPAATRAPCGHPGALGARRVLWSVGVTYAYTAPPGRAGQRAARPAGPRFIMTLALVQAPAHSQGAQAALKAHTGKAGRAGRRTQRTHRQSRAGGAPHADPAMINTGTQSKIRAGRRRGEGKNVCGRCAARTPFYLSTNVFAAGFARPLLLLTV